MNRDLPFQVGNDEQHFGSFGVPIVVFKVNFARLFMDWRPKISILKSMTTAAVALIWNFATTESVAVIAIG
jgi:hypothetical protein